MTAGAGISVERIGLLFVHGIGEQKRFEHLRSSVQEFAELLRQAHDNAIVTITDRTKDWPYPVGTPAPDDVAPISIAFRSGGGQPRQVHFECHEVWWADLGTRSGVIDVVSFWFWGLGQWGAPMYQEFDASGLRKDAKALTASGKAKPVPSLTRLPLRAAGKLKVEPWVRIRLAAAALGALLVAFGWMLVKRAFQAALGQAPSPTLMVQYVGDVRTYEARWTPGDSNLCDPGHPRRVAIRRRMVAEMVAMGARARQGTLNAWYVCAHSLGTVVAYNGLTEISHALPNYLSREQWQALPPDLRHDPGCGKRPPEDLHKMMPSRPDWLDYEDVINRPLLFEKLRGLLTYGSPLDKFAAIWPRIVATAIDRKDEAGQPISPFHPSCEWINLADPVDPVAGTLDSYNSGKVAALKGAVPQVFNVVTPLGWLFGLAHIRYFTGVKDENTSLRSQQKRRIMTWLVQRALEPFPDELKEPEGELARNKAEPWTGLWLLLGYSTILVALATITAALWWLVFEVSDQLLNGGLLKGIDALPDWHGPVRLINHIVGGSLALILLLGLLRWAAGSAMNMRQAARDYVMELGVRRFSLWRAFRRQMAVYHERPHGLQRLHHCIYHALDKLLPPDREGRVSDMEEYWRWLYWMFFWQTWAARLSIALFTGLLAIFGLHFLPPDWSAYLWSWLAKAGACLWALGEHCHAIGWPVIVAGFILIASLTQTLLNKIVPGTSAKTEIPRGTG